MDDLSLHVQVVSFLRLAYLSGGRWHDRVCACGISDAMIYGTGTGFGCWLIPQNFHLFFFGCCLVMTGLLQLTGCHLYESIGTVSGNCCVPGKTLYACAYFVVPNANHPHLHWRRGHPSMAEVLFSFSRCPSAMVCWECGVFPLFLSTGRHSAQLSITDAPITMHSHESMGLINSMSPTAVADRRGGPEGLFVYWLSSKM